MLSDKIKPIGDRVVVRFGEKEEERGGILLPDNAKEQSQEAVVVALGTQVEDGVLKVGDVVLTSKYVGTEIKDGDEVCKIYRTDEILAIVG